MSYNESGCGRPRRCSHAAPEITKHGHGLVIDGLQPVALVNFPGIVRSHARVSGRDDVVSRRHLSTFQNLQMQANAHYPAFEVLGAVSFFAAEELYAAVN